MLGVRYAVAGAIGGYQRWISPYKGFHCAHWTLHGDSCSAFGKRLVLEQGVIGFFLGMRARFADCRRSSEALQARRELLICLASHATPVVDGKADAEAEDGDEDPVAGKGRKRGGGWTWADCLEIPDCGSMSSCDFDIPSCNFDVPSCDCSW